MVEILACGELLIDFIATEAGLSLADAPAFQKAPGGAPANVAVGLARLGLASGFLGKVGDDDFGQFLVQTLAENGVDVTHVKRTGTARTALAFVSLAHDGEREFLFYRHPSADMLLAPEDIEESTRKCIASSKVFHYGSIALSSQPSQSATLHALSIAQAHQVCCSYDPNLRLHLWPSAEAARAGILLGWSHANLIKVSQEELLFLTGEADVHRSVPQLWHDELRLLVVTQGMEGCTYFTPYGSGHVPGYVVKAVDTTGAGDGFFAGFLYKLHPMLQRAWQQDELEAALRFANAVGALTVTRRGAIPALPTLQEVESFLENSQ